MLAPVVFGIYAFAHLVILMFSIGQLTLAYYAFKSRRRAVPSTPIDNLSELPFVTIQLPIYNERYVVERLLNAVSAIDYPKDRLEIQILDDSTDETTAIIAESASRLRASGFQVHHLRRGERIGFKAGALQFGLEQATGDFIAIFDADFVPPSSFLKTVLPAFDSVEVGMVQTRWSHLNSDYSVLTELQAFGLDAHFNVEQQARHTAGFFINFNGTAGIWRKSTIQDAGGWHTDTLTEDLDLSYRAQLKGWKFKFLGEVESPSELPAEMSSYKSQQFRWAKGAIETAKKHLPDVWKSNISLVLKFHSTLHLCANALFILIFLSGLLTVPLMIIKNTTEGYDLYFQIMTAFLISFISSVLFYLSALSGKSLHQSLGAFSKKFSLFIAFMMGMSLHNSLAVLEGLLGRKSAFIRTPKFGLQRLDEQWTRKAYLTTTLTPTTVFEIIFALYYLFGAAVAVYFSELSLLPFQVLFSTGFALVAILSIYHVHLSKS